MFRHPPSRHLWLLLFLALIGLPACGPSAADPHAETITRTVAAAEVEPLLRTVATTVGRGFGSADAARLGRIARHRWLPARRGGAYTVRRRGVEMPLSVRLEHLAGGRVRVHLSADPALAADLRDVLDGWYPHPVHPIEGSVAFHVMVGGPVSRAGTVPVALTARTENEYGCVGYTIAHRFAAGDTLRVRLDGIRPVPGDVCLTALAPATLERTLALAPGEYRLEFRYRNATDTYRLRVTGDGAEVTGEPGGFTRPAPPPR